VPSIGAEEVNHGEHREHGGRFQPVDATSINFPKR
jgi:hypothetical protein